MATTTILRYAAFSAAITCTFTVALAQQRSQLSVHFASASSELDEQALVSLENYAIASAIIRPPP